MNIGYDKHIYGNSILLIQILFQNSVDKPKG